MLLVNYYTIKILNISVITKKNRHKRASGEELFLNRKETEKRRRNPKKAMS